jgi:hypothetical protein
VLTPYDEYPVHQTSGPFTEIPSTDLGWDDGYFFGAYSAQAEAFLFTGLRVSPNSDVVGAYAGLMHRGIQRTVRLSRIWRPDFDVAVGPLHFDIVEPMHRFGLRLGPNPSALTFELEWTAVAPPYEEHHHLAMSRGRRTTDQTRYVQCGRPTGWIDTDGERLEVGEGWHASRDRSWGLYAPRRPLGDQREWLPPPEPGGRRRALRWWMPFQTDDHVGFLHFHEDEDGRRDGLGDVFATPFEGWIDRGGRRIGLVDVDHEASLAPGTRSLEWARLDVTDEDGGHWTIELRTATQPWFPLTIGYHQGSWSDGGNIATYHPADDGVHVEHETLDLSVQPFEHQLYGGPAIPGLYGMEHVVVVRSTGPDGTTGHGLAQVELFIEGAYRPYGLA